MTANLEIYTFGNFRVENGDKRITRDKSKSSKRWKLLQYLLTYNEQEISRDELIMVLGLNNNDDPESALSALVYRLRKYLTRHTDRENGYYIKTTGAAYTFNNNADYWLDAEEFENLCQNTQQLIKNNSSEAVEIFEKALSLYNGDYLQDARTEEWLWSARNYYRDLLKNTLLKIDSFLKEQNNCEKLMEFYERIQSLIKFDEEIIAGLLKTMIEMGRISEAQKRFDEINQMYEDDDLILPPKFKNIFIEIQVEEIEDPEVFLENLNDSSEEEGAYLCTPDKFMDLYELEKRRVKRDVPQRCIIHFRLTEKKAERQKEIAINHIDKIGEQFLQLLTDQLRSGDIVSHWQKKHFIALLSNLDREEAEKVSQRIKNSFKARYGLPDDMGLENKIQELS